MKKSRQLALCAVLVALALALSYMERLIPLQLLLPLPGVKLGLANIVTLLTLYCFSRKTAFSILLVRCLLGSAFGGGLSGLALSLSGGIAALLVMLLAQRLPFLSIYGISILGAAAHNGGQVAAVMVLLCSTYTLAYLPFLLLVSIGSGCLTGAVSAACLRALSASQFFTAPPQ